ncbi:MULTISPECIES: terminase large subunit domain-containing protein [unclassified Yoonia]|uniref:terminase large subunit domain-containing protein n=1 Tax=unclassified Yoonia TaxID=2629118 RepID=UPI002AFE8775|nr:MULTISPECIES: terminase family protein [unclassified Yoonia]
MLDAPSQEEWEAQRREAMDAMPDVIDQVGLPEVLLPYQQRTVSLLDSVSTQALYIEKSRRIGLTWALAAYAVLRAGRQKSAGGMDVMYISYSREMTREFIDACAMWARAFSVAALAEEEFLFEQGDEDGDKAIQAFRIPFASGFEIMALSSAPRGLRGKQGVVIIDEAAFVDSLDTLIEAAMAFLMWGGQVVVCSTHYGVDNQFNASIQDVLSERAPGEHLRIDLDDALRDGLYQRICLVKGTEWTPEGEAAWRAGIVKFYGASADQELFCVPSASSGTWLPSPLIDARMTIDKPVIRLTLPADFLQRSNLEQRSLVAPFMEQIEEELGGLDMTMRYALGFDVGRVADLSAVPLLAIDQKLRQHEALSIEMRNVPFAEQYTAVELVMNHVRNRLVGAAIDATGIGMSIAEALGRKFGLREDEEGSGLVWAIKFSEDWYRVNMPPLKAAFEDDTLALIRDDDHMSDLRVVKVIRGIPRVPPTRQGEKGKMRHGDFAIGLALAHFAGRMRWVEYGYRAASPASSAPRETGRMNMLPPDDRTQKQRAWWDTPLGAGLRGGGL